MAGAISSARRRPGSRGAGQNKRLRFACVLASVASNLGGDTQRVMMLRPAGIRRLSAIDASFLQMESTHAHMHVGWSAICSPLGDAERPTIEALRERAASRIGLAPSARQRVLFAPLGFGEPRWIDD